MPTQRVTETTTRGPTTERVTYVDGGNGAGGLLGVIVGIAALALVAIVAFYLLSANRNDALRTDAVTSAASAVASSAQGAANSVGDAAQGAADSVNN